MTFRIPDTKKSDIDIYSANIIQEDAPDKYHISEHEEKVLTCWDEFYK